MTRFAALLLVVSILLAVMTEPIEAQTSTPTPPPYPVVTFPPVMSPTPILTSTPFVLQSTVVVPHSEIYNGLATVESSLNSAPANITNPGLPILPGTQGAELFGYAKWVLSASTASEVFGLFGVVVIHLAARLVMMAFLAALSMLIFLVTFVLKFIIWIVFKIRAIFP